MNEINRTKDCPICYKKIDGRAKKCPYCHYWQSKMRHIFFNPAFTIITVFFIVIGAQEYFRSQFYGSEEDFNSNKDKISIAQSELSFGENKCGSLAVIIGSIKNDALISWECPNFEVKFYDKDKKIVDTKQDEIYSFEIPAKTELPFKISIPMSFPTESYQTYEIKLLSAKRKGALF